MAPLYTITVDSFELQSHRGIEQGPRIRFGNEDFKRAMTPTPISSRVRSQGFFSPVYLPQCLLPPP